MKGFWYQTNQTNRNWMSYRSKYITLGIISIDKGSEIMDMHIKLERKINIPETYRLPNSTIVTKEFSAL